MESSPPPTTTTTHIALVSVPAFSHQVSILEFAKRLLHLHTDTFHVTCIIPTLSSSSSKHSFFFDSLPRNIHCIFLPSVNFQDLNNNGASVEIQTQLSASRAMSSVRETLVSLSRTTAITALIADAMAPEALELGKELNILSYIYFPCSTMVLSICFHSRNLDHEVSCEYKDHPGLIPLPGCISISGRDLPDSMQDRGSLAYKLFLQRCQRYLDAHDGILVNSFMELEEETTKAISEHEHGNGNEHGNGAGNGNGGDYPPVYLVGPITQSGSRSRCECLLWLDKQQPDSVLYVSFGSGGTLSQEQINELALGLELSKHKFLWVNLRAPNDRASATYFSDGGLVDDDDDPLQFLPKGFLERTKEQGLVMCGWAPQVEVLGHRSIGAFLSHCGWNSVLESVVHGVPMIAWPLFAEQRSNAALVSEGLKVALRAKMKNPRGKSNGVVVKEEIVELIKGVMEEGLEGEEIRRKVKELKKLANCAMMEDGSSTRTIEKLVNKWKRLGKSL
ncbi:hydroquinone glucosyltransferase-like [Vigna unguiculata]|uniref:Glycosyltransferase n=1 Tax=Vigna unguiculata TaxID=3917 RepID=A0A4D6MVD4_VIGUN|nr:hydroquinone glucosyltransferase-like [Vigna unguiculata]QCE04714.1 hydroquinone glucosyltransferase [Vigna unguiculata]